VFVLDFCQNLEQNDSMTGRIIPAIALLVLPSSYLSGQQSSLNRLIHLTVTDPLNRFVTGLDRDNFEITESGVRRSITSFSTAADSIAIAVVSEAPLTDLDLLQEPSELIQTRSVSDAVRQLVASGKPRKALIVTADGGAETLPEGIFIVRTDANRARKTVVEACNQYTVGFTSVDPSVIAEVSLKQPSGLPTLKINIWK
jgi:hypothetical protein